MGVGGLDTQQETESAHSRTKRMGFCLVACMRLWVEGKETPFVMRVTVGRDRCTSR
jgi:hypothetical protein